MPVNPTLDIRCPVCLAILTAEEIKQQECWSCQAQQEEKDYNSLFNSNDTHLLPNLIKR